VQSGRARKTTFAKRLAAAFEQIQVAVTVVCFDGLACPALREQRTWLLRFLTLCIVIPNPDSAVSHLPPNQRFPDSAAVPGMA
jgi:hypothetical protein